VVIAARLGRPSLRSEATNRHRRWKETVRAFVTILLHEHRSFKNSCFPFPPHAGAGVAGWRLRWEHPLCHDGFTAVCSLALRMRHGAAAVRMALLALLSIRLRFQAACGLQNVGCSSGQALGRKRNEILPRLEHLIEPASRLRGHIVIYARSVRYCGKAGRPRGQADGLPDGEGPCRHHHRELNQQQGAIGRRSSLGSRLAIRATRRRKQPLPLSP